MKDLTKGNIYKTFFLFALPMVLAGVLSQCYSIVNTIVAGKLLGEDALGAIGAVSPLITFINSVFWGFGTGVGIYTGQLFGAGNYEKVKRVIVNNFKFISVTITVISVLLLIFRYDIYSFLNVDKNIIEDANRYFFVSIAGSVILLFSTNCIYVINAIGDGTFPFLMSVISTVLHITFGVTAITVFDMGVEGLALGNVLSSAVIDIMYLLKFLILLQKIQSEQQKNAFQLQRNKGNLQILALHHDAAISHVFRGNDTLAHGKQSWKRGICQLHGFFAHLPHQHGGISEFSKNRRKLHRAVLRWKKAPFT